MNKERKRLRQRYRQFMEQAQEVMNRHDPLGLVSMGSPVDEYSPELGTIVPRLKEAVSEEDAVRIVDEELRRWFGDGAAGGRERCLPLGCELFRLWATWRAAPILTDRQAGAGPNLPEGARHEEPASLPGRR